MAHCPFEKLADLKSELETIRKLPIIKEPKPGIFYLRSQSFLHFHIKDDRRWADIRAGKAWGTEVEIAFGSSPKQRAKFLKEVVKRHSLVLEQK